MKKKIIWLLVSCLMVLSLLLASCAPAAPPEEEKPAPPTEEKPAPPKEEKPAPPEEEKPAPSLGKIQYGGTITRVIAEDVWAFDEAYFPSYLISTLDLTNEELMIGDWTRGPGGTGEASWTTNACHPLLWAGRVAESWEVPDEKTMIFHIRKGIFWHDKPPVNGRELTADDVVFTLKYIYQDTKSYNRLSAPAGMSVESITSPDKWTVVVKVPGLAAAWVEDVGDKMHIIPHEMIEKYGDMKDWRNSCGTGPFMLTDYIPHGSMTFVKHPNYWGKDPFHPENSIPYVDIHKWLVISDFSTRMAALRTGKVDFLRDVPWEDAETLLESKPEMQWRKAMATVATPIFWRTDTKPFDDIRVRRALHLAVDNQEIKDEFYGGNAEILSHPVLAATPELGGYYVPLEELPAETRELYEYHPDKARQLLAEAGYPDGFKTEMICYQAQVDLLSVFVAYWADIGVEVKLDIKEYSVWNSITAGRTHKAMAMRYSGDYMPWRFFIYVPYFIHNLSMIDDPIVNEAYEKVQATFTDYKERARIYREIVPYILSQAWTIAPPTPYYYNVWWPWLKGYHGERSIGYANEDVWVQWAWIDQSLKEEMTGRR